MKTLALLLLSALCCFSQGFDDVAFVAQANYVETTTSELWKPTDDTSYPPLAWYVASDVVTNGAKLELASRAAVQNLTITNWDAASKWPVYNSSGPNSKPFLNFDGTDDYLRVGYAALNNPYEVWIVMRKQMQNSATEKYIFGNYAAVRPMVGGYINEHNGVLDLDFAHNRYWDTNVWIVLNTVWSGTTGTTYTNNVQAHTVTITSRTLSGWTIGVRNSLDRGAKVDIAELIVYTNQIPNASAAVRSNLFWYCTNKYAITF